MHLFVCDETNIQYADDRFLIYGGLIFSEKAAVQVTKKVERIRRDNNFDPTDPLKFNTRERPDHIDPSQHAEIKNKVVECCLSSGCIFISKIIHHRVIEKQSKKEQLYKSADYVIGRFNKYLINEGGYGMVIMDTLPNKTEFEYIKKKFRVGLEMYTGESISLDKIIGFTSTCDGASHLSSATDIVVGCFRYSMNNPENEDAASEMMGNVGRLMWGRSVEGSHKVRGRGLIVRPKVKDIKSSKIKRRYKEAIDHLQNLVDRR